jgi:D-aminopeptidase
VETKRSLSYYAADCRSPHDVQEDIREAARRALAQRGDLRLFELAQPRTLEVETMKTSQADAIERLAGFTRLGPRTVRFGAGDMREVYRALVALIHIGTAAEA